MYIYQIITIKPSYRFVGAHVVKSAHVENREWEVTTLGHAIREVQVQVGVPFVRIGVYYLETYVRQGAELIAEASHYWNKTIQ